MDDIYVVKETTLELKKQLKRNPCPSPYLGPISSQTKTKLK